MNKRTSFALLLSWLCTTAGFARADFTADVRAASEELEPTLVEAWALLADGRYADANQKILAVFPERTRSAAQAFVLGRALYSQNPKASYELHRRAAHDLPNEAQVQFDWAMEQHRAGEYSGAATGYAAYSRAHPKYGPAYGLHAECLLRVGKTKEAVAMWRESQESLMGTMNELERLVCAVNSHLFPDRERADLLAKVSAGDLDAAEKLISLDCSFERDWWDKRIEHDYLKHDSEILLKAKFEDAERLREIICAVSCSQKTRGSDGYLLRRQGYFFGYKSALPTSSSMCLIMLERAGSVDELRKQWGPVALDRTKTAKDVDTFRVARALCTNTEQVPEIDRMAWSATGDVRFAELWLLWQDGVGKLTLDDPLLTVAAQRFPDDAVIAGLIVRMTAKANKPLEAALVNAIKAEYHRFSPSSHLAGIDLPRRGAELRAAHFAKLEQVIESK